MMSTLYLNQYSLKCTLLLLLSLHVSNLSSQVSVVRLNRNEPIITRLMNGTDANINGPSMIRIPDWIPREQRASPSAVYYLYFSSHWGQHIKMAWSERIEGPYTIYDPGIGVFHIDSFLILGKLQLKGHIASPDVHVDHAKRQIIMYFHTGKAYWAEDRINDQKTVVATSPYGLDFNSGLKDAIISPFYARVFEYDHHLYALTKKGLYRALDLNDPWGHSRNFNNIVPELWNRIGDPFSAFMNEVRHSTVLKEGSKLHVMYSSYPSSPEHIEYSVIDLSKPDWLWKANETADVLFPEFPWEGVNYPLGVSKSGWDVEVHELSDPYLFADNDGQVYLLYTGAGENAIGISHVSELINSTEPDCSTDTFIYPNPVEGNDLFISGLRETSVRISSMTGQIFIEQEVGSSSISLIDVSSLPNGAYLVMIKNGSNWCRYILVRI